MKEIFPLIFQIESSKALASVDGAGTVHFDSTHRGPSVALIATLIASAGGVILVALFFKRYDNLPFIIVKKKMSAFLIFVDLPVLQD